MDKWTMQLEAIREDFSVKPAESRRLFRVLSDVGITAGNRTFCILKGALNGGLDIPHGDEKFAGSNKEEKPLDSDVHRKGQMAAYMRVWMEEESKKHQSHFTEYNKRKSESNDIEEIRLKDFPHST
jgi:large subunit ribosomal protein L5e